MVLCRGRDPEAEIATFLYEGPGTGYASFSNDFAALYIPTLRLCPDTVRRAVAGESLFMLLSGASLLQREEGSARFHHAEWTWCWGDLRLFETGEPIVSRAILLRGVQGMPDIEAVKKYLGEMQRAS